MDTITAIKTRRSIRKYTGKKITDEQLHELLDCAMWAPSAMGKFPWEFIVVTDEEILAQIKDVHPYAAFAEQAGAAIMVCANMTKTPKMEFAIQDTSAAIQNILLAAKAMGLGTCWCGVAGNEERTAGFRKLLAIDDENIIPMSLIVVGDPAEDPQKPSRFDENNIHYNKW